jgi:hypothetical protein
MNHGHYGYREKNFHRMLKETFTTLSMTQKQQRLVDCETYRILRISMYQLDVMKHRHDMTGTWKCMKLWGYRSTQKFPRCGHHCETAAHVTMCTSPSAIEQWKISLETLGKDIVKRHTHPGLTRFLLSMLLEWKTRTPRKAL